VKRLAPIEGLRAYLAFWVLVGHVMSLAGYAEAQFDGLLKLLMEPRLAVDIFMAVSGWVIFSLLDRRAETYGQFITRRFFRLYPVYILLFFLGMECTQLQGWAIRHGAQFLTPDQASVALAQVGSLWQDWGWNTFLHVTMLHGVPPDWWHGEMTKFAFLVPAWSVSLEWQFYLAAPLAYLLATHPNVRVRGGLCAACVLLIWAGARFDWGEAFFPFNIGFFFVGAASYFIYQHETATKQRLSVFPAAVVLALFVFDAGTKSRTLIPLSLWLMFAALLLEPPESLCAKWLHPLFTNRTVQFLGKISYSIYLSHEPVIFVIQAGMVLWLPHLGRAAHFWALLGATVVVTVAVSAVLYHTVELPGIRLGRTLAARFKPEQELVPATT
jgi:peptidoglycan/LPS O-acetylase OafA/YrhL